MSNDKFIWSQSGEHAVTIPTAYGSLEAIITIPEHPDFSYIAVVCHPHSLHGGSMNNKVVTTLTKVFQQLAIPSARFNFRGVGLSDGSFDQGMGEADDLRSILAWISQYYPQAKFCLSGFSFGSFVAYQVSSDPNVALLITVAPPVHHFNFRKYAIPQIPWLVIQGDEDEVVPPDQVFNWLDELSSPVHLLRFSQTTHFFHGKLLELRDRLLPLITQLLSL